MDKHKIPDELNGCFVVRHVYESRIENIDSLSEQDADKELVREFSDSEDKPRYSLMSAGTIILKYKGR